MVIRFSLRGGADEDSGQAIAEELLDEGAVGAQHASVVDDEAVLEQIGQVFVARLGHGLATK